MMKFCWTTIHVKNIEESLKFYETIVGLEVNRSFKSGESREIIFLGDGESTTEVELICDKGVNVSMSHDISLGFTVESVDEKIAFIKSQGYAIHSGPVQPSPFIKFFYVEDPNGLKIQFVENI